MENFIKMLTGYIESVKAVAITFEWFEVVFTLLAGLIACIIGMSFDTLLCEWNSNKLNRKMSLTAVLGALVLAVAIAFPFWTNGFYLAAILWVLWCFIVGCEKINFVALIILLVYFIYEGIAA